MGLTLYSLSADCFNLVLGLLEIDSITFLWLTGSKSLHERLKRLDKAGWNFSYDGAVPFPFVVQYLIGLSSLSLQNDRSRLEYPIVRSSFFLLPNTLRKLEFRFGVVENHFATSTCLHTKDCRFNLRSVLPNLESLTIGDSRTPHSSQIFAGNPRFLEALPNSRLSTLKLFFSSNWQFTLDSMVSVFSKCLEIFATNIYLTHRPNQRPIEWPESLVSLELFNTTIPPSCFENLPPNLETLIVHSIGTDCYFYDESKLPSSVKQLIWPSKLRSISSLPRSLQLFISSISTAYSNRGDSYCNSLEFLCEFHRHIRHDSVPPATPEQSRSLLQLPSSLTVFCGALPFQLSAKEMDMLPCGITDLNVPLDDLYRKSIEGSCPKFASWVLGAGFNGDLHAPLLYQHLVQLVIAGCTQAISPESFQQFPRTLRSLCTSPNFIASSKCFATMPPITSLYLIMIPLIGPALDSERAFDLEDEWRSLPTSLTKLVLKAHSPVYYDVHLPLKVILKGISSSLHRLECLDMQCAEVQADQSWDIVPLLPRSLTQLHMRAPCLDRPSPTLFSQFPPNLRQLTLEGYLPSEWCSKGVFKLLPKSLSHLSLPSKKIRPSPDLYPPYLAKLDASTKIHIFSPKVASKQVRWSVRKLSRLMSTLGVCMVLLAALALLYK